MGHEMEFARAQESQTVQRLAWMNAGVIYLDLNCTLTIHNALAAYLLDVAVPVGTSESLDTCMDPEREEAKVLRHVVQNKCEWRNQIVTWTGNGGIRHVLIDSYLNLAANGDVNGVYIVMKDMGDFAIIDQHMQRTERLATVGKVAAGVAHEIRNPLTTVRGFLEIMMDQFVERDWPDGLRYGECMLREMDKMDGLVQDLLLLSKPQQFSTRPCQIPELVREIQASLTGKLSMDVELEVIIENVPDVVAEPEMVKYVLRQLLENAIEAMESNGHLTIHVRNAGRTVEVDIQDTGPGIPYYQMDKLFDAFFTTKDKGTGLGLPICQRIVADHRGEIRVSSKGFGTTFTVVLPILEATVKADSVG